MDTTLIAEFLVVLVISLVFSMFGKGGGSLYTPILILFGLTVSAAVSTSLFLNLLVAFTAMIVFAWHKIVDYRIAAIFAPGTIAGIHYRRPNQQVDSDKRCPRNTRHLSSVRRHQADPDGKKES